jgi:hypothetical protein
VVVFYAFLVALATADLLLALAILFFPKVPIAILPRLVRLSPLPMFLFFVFII